MTPFFKRNRRRRKAAEVISPASPASAPSASSADSVGTEALGGANESDTIDAASSQSTANEATSHEPPVLTAKQRVDNAYQGWWADLSQTARTSARPLSALDPAVVDLSSPHPTGGAQLYSGMPTLLSSLVREESAQRIARGRLNNLRHQMRQLSESYGYAPVTLAIGEISWQLEPQPAAEADEAVTADEGAEQADASLSSTSPSESDAARVSSGASAVRGPGSDDDVVANVSAETPETSDTAGTEQHSEEANRVLASGDDAVGDESISHIDAAHATDEGEGSEPSAESDPGSESSSEAGHGSAANPEEASAVEEPEVAPDSSAATPAESATAAASSPAAAGESSDGSAQAPQRDAAAGETDEAQTDSTVSSSSEAQANPPEAEPDTLSATATRQGPAENATIPAEVRTEAVLLRTVRLQPSGEDDASITLTAKCEVNPAVVRALLDAGVLPEEIAKLSQMAATPSQEEAVLARVRELGRRNLHEFGYEPRVLLGSFIHPGQALLADLEAMKPYIEGSGIMAALAGDEATKRLASAPLPPAERHDRAPEAERGAGDRDVAELAAIEAVASGRSVAIDTPPGSEKVGTLAGIVADAAASGRSVLYIPGGATAGRTFIDQMQDLGLEDLVLDFSDMDSVPTRLRTGLRLRHDEPQNDEIFEIRARLTKVRKGLDDYVESLHKVDGEWNESVYSLLERLASLTAQEDGPSSRTRLNEKALRTLRDSYERIQNDLLELASLGTFSANGAVSVWTGSKINTVEEASKALARATRIAQETLPVAMAQSQRVAGESSLERAATLDDWIEQIRMLNGISKTLDVFLPQVYERSVADLVAATASKEWREEQGLNMKSSERRRLTRQARDMVRPGATVTDLNEELEKVQRLRETWRRYSSEGGWPTLPDGMGQIKATAAEVYREVKALEASLAPGTDLVNMRFEDLLVLVRQLASGQDAMATLPRRNAMIARIGELGLEAIVEDFSARHVAVSQVPDELSLIYVNSVFEQLVVRTPTLANVGPADLKQMSEQLRHYDKEHTRTLANPVRRAVVRIMRETISKRRDETMAFDSQLARYGSGGLRDAIAKYPRLVQVARPVWTIPSMMTAEFVPPMPWADVVIMDEMDAADLSSSISMLMRGSQVVVMGDLRRAPEGSAIAELAKVLPVCELPTLRAKYDELATQTLREQGYADVLQMIPAVPRSDRARLVVVNGRGVPSPATGAVEGTQAEVDAVVDMVVDHTLAQPGKSLAVVCVSEHHATRVREAIRQTVAKSTVLDALNERDVHEPFLVLDITRCAGLRRDSIILSVGYGKTVHGRVLHSFGALSSPVGVAGLVDAVEAAREELTIVSALGPGEIGVEKITSPGPRLLARLIDRAGGAVVQLDPTESGEPVEPLLADLVHRLREAGWATAAHFGYDDGVRIPLVVGHPRLRGTWRVAVLLDDHSYVEEHSLRRRDRYWAERLEARGWAVFRTFSTSLFIDPEGQAQEVIDILEKMRSSELGAAVLPLEPIQVPVLDEDWSAPTVLTPEEQRYVQTTAGSDSAWKRADDAKPRGPRPQLTPGLPLAAYSDDQLDEMIAWIVSDELPRDEEELVQNLREELDIHRRGGQVDAVLRNVVRRSNKTTLPEAQETESKPVSAATSLRDTLENLDDSTEWPDAEDGENEEDR
ncbi:hypothetical protein VR010_00100 [Actinomycetaceae bacterium L2_0104]